MQLLCSRWLPQQGLYTEPIRKAEIFYPLSTHVANNYIPLVSGVFLLLKLQTNYNGGSREK